MDKSKLETIGLLSQVKDYYPKLESEAEMVKLAKVHRGIDCIHINCVRECPMGDMSGGDICGELMQVYRGKR